MVGITGRIRIIVTDAPFPARAQGNCHIHKHLRHSRVSKPNSAGC